MPFSEGSTVQAVQEEAKREKCAADSIRQNCCGSKKPPQDRSISARFREADLAQLRTNMATLAREFDQALQSCLDNWAVHAFPAQAVSSSRKSHDENQQSRVTYGRSEAFPCRSTPLPLPSSFVAEAAAPLPPGHPPGEFDVLGQREPCPLSQACLFPRPPSTQDSLRETASLGSPAATRCSTQSQATYALSCHPTEPPGLLNSTVPASDSCNEFNPFSKPKVSVSATNKWAIQRHNEDLAKTLHRSPSRKFKTDKRHVDDYLTPVAREAAQGHATWLEMLVSSSWYEWASAALIILNAVLIGIQVQMMAITGQEKANEGDASSMEVPTHFRVFDILFCGAFAIDLGLRWYVDGPLTFFQTKDRGWNAFDVGIVSVSIVEALLDVISKGNNLGSNVSLIRVLRIIRVVRILRVVKVISFFRELRMMISSIVSSMTSMVWVAMTFLLIFFMFGVCFTQAVTEFCGTEAKWTSSDTLTLRESFGTLDKSILTLFLSISGGQDWGENIQALKPLQGHYQILFIWYMFFAFFAAINVVTGVFVDNAMHNSTQDREHIIQQEMKGKSQSVKVIRELFEELDTTNNGSVTIAEFQDHLDDERVVAFFSAMKLEFDDTSVLFNLLDTDGSGEVSFEEFCIGCERLKGEAKSMDLALLRLEVASLAKMVKDALQRPTPSAVRSASAGAPSDAVFLW